MTDTIIKTEGLTKDYGKGRGIFGVDLEVKAGEVYGYIGTNGSGKTTTIRGMMGFIRPDAGSVQIMGLDTWKHATELKKYVSYIPGEIEFPRFPTGIDFLHYQAGFLKIKDFSYMNSLIARLLALAQSEGCFSGEELSIENMMTTTLEVMGVSTDLVENMSKMDATSMLNRMYFTVMGLLPIFLLIVLYSNSLLASQVDNGSMAYILSTPTKRSSVAVTQAVFMILAPLIVMSIVCCVKLFANTKFMDDTNLKAAVALYLGMYLLVQAVAGICYLGSCLFNQSSRAMAFGGGLTVWFFLASMLGMFGSEDLVNMGVGVERLGIFNRLTLVGLYDIEALNTEGTDAVDDSFIWKLAVLAGIAVVCYVAGTLRFTKKDLPL